MTFGWMNNEDFITFADGNKITNKYIYMGGIFGTISKKSCVADLFYGTDYNSHLGTRRGGMATFCKEKGFVRSIHNLESSYFRTKFEPTLDRFEGATSGIGVISDTDAQPLIMNSHLGKFAICTVAKILNKDELTIEMQLKMLVRNLRKHGISPRCRRAAQTLRSSWRCSSSRARPSRRV